MHDEEQAARRAMRIALGVAMGLLNDREEAADVAQNVALDVLRSLDQLREPAAFDAWVRKIAVRHALRARDTQRRFASDTTRRSSSDSEVAAKSIDHDLLVAGRMALAEALAALPSRQAAALVLRYVLDLTDRQIADALGCRRSTANSLLSRGRESLRQVDALKELADAMEMTQ
jgi:RNA polymerase sigma factor (sigma-70 family)